MQQYKPSHQIQQLAIKYKQSPSPHRIQNSKSLHQDLQDFENELKHNIQKSNQVITQNSIQKNFNYQYLQPNINKQTIKYIPYQPNSFRSLDKRPQNSVYQYDSNLRVQDYKGHTATTHNNNIISRQDISINSNRKNYQKIETDISHYVNSSATTGTQNQFSDRKILNQQQQLQNNSNLQLNQSGLSDKFANTITNDQSQDFIKSNMNKEPTQLANLEYQKDISVSGSQLFNMKQEFNQTKKRSVTTNNAQTYKYTYNNQEADKIINDINGQYTISDHTKATLTRQQYQDLYMIEKGKNDHLKKEIQEFKQKVENLIEEKEIYKLKYENELTQQKNKNISDDLKKQVEIGEFNSLKQKLFSHEKEEILLKKEVENLKRQKIDVEKLLQQARNSLKKQENNFQEEQIGQKGQIEQLQKEIQKLNCDLTIKQYDSKDQEIVKERLQKIQTANESLNFEKEQLQQQILQKQGAISELQFSEKQLQQQVKIQEQEINGLREKEKQQNQVQNDKNLVDNKVKELQQTLEVERAHLKIVTKNYEDTQLKLNQRQEEIIEKNNSIQELKDQHNQLQQQVQLDKKQFESDLEIQKRQLNINFQQQFEKEKQQIQQEYKKLQLDQEEQGVKSEREQKENFERLQEMHQELNAQFKNLSQTLEQCDEERNYHIQQNQGLQQTIQELQIENQSLQGIQKQHTKIIGEQQDTETERVQLQQRVQQLVKYEVQYGLLQKEYQNQQQQIQQMDQELKNNSNETIQALHTKIRFLMSENTRLNNIILSRCKTLQQW